MNAQVLLKEKEWVIGHKIVDIQVTRERGIRIIMDDGKDITISLAVRPAEIAKTELSAFISPACHVEIAAQIAIPASPELIKAREAIEEEDRKVVEENLPHCSGEKEQK